MNLQMFEYYWLHLFYAAIITFLLCKPINFCFCCLISTSICIFKIYFTNVHWVTFNSNVYYKIVSYNFLLSFTTLSKPYDFQEKGHFHSFMGSDSNGTEILEQLQSYSVGGFGDFIFIILLLICSFSVYRFLYDKTEPGKKIDPKYTEVSFTNIIVVLHWLFHQYLLIRLLLILLYYFLYLLIMYHFY